MNKRFKKLLRTILFLSTGILILYWVYYKQNQAYIAECVLKGISQEDCSLIKKVVMDFKEAKGWILAITLLLFMISNLSRALRWHMLLKPLGVKAKLHNSFFSIMLGYFANLGLPRVGEVIRAATLAKYEGVKMDKVMGTVIVDRFMDVVMMALFMFLAMISATSTFINFLSENSDLNVKINSVITNPIIWIALLLGVIGLAIVLKSNKFRNSKPGAKVRSFIGGVIEGIKSIASLEKPWLFVFHSIVIWVMYYLMLYIGFFAFAPTEHLGPVPGLVVFMLGSLGILIPSPGGMGTYHFLVTEGLGLYGVNGADGFSFANIIFFTIQIFGNIVFGLLALALLPALNRQKKQNQTDVKEDVNV